MKRAIALLLLASLAVSAAACAEKQDDLPAVTTEAASTLANEEELDSLEARKLVSDNLPEADFEGADFNIYVQKEFEYDGGVEDYTGEPLDDVIYERNQNVGERFGVNITYQSDDHATMSNNIRKAVTSDDDAYQLCMAHIIQNGTNILNDNFYNLAEVDYIDTTRPWYPKFAIETSTINDRIYALVSDASLSSCVQTYCVYFNKAIAANYNIVDDDLYSLVNNGQWTIDRLDEYVKMVYEDLNGNSRRDGKDLYGTKSIIFYSFNFLWAFDQPIMEVKDESVEFLLNNEKTVAILDKLYSFYYENEGNYHQIDYIPSKQAFANGEGMFLLCHFGPALAELRDMEEDYGIIPFPKWDEEQAAYKTTIDGSFDVLSIPTTVRDIEMAGLLTEALSAYSWKNVLPVFYDISLKVKGSRDEESIAMIDTILDSRVVDFSFMYTGFDGFNFILSDMLSQKKNGNNFASTYASKVRGAQRLYDKALEYFYE